MDRNGLYLRTIEDLGHRTRQGATEYDCLMAAGLVRKLLLDAEPLAHAVNRNRRLKLEFEVTDDDLQLPPGLPVPDLQARYEGISPRLGSPLPLVRLQLERFLKAVALRVHGTAVTVHEVVDQVAHIEGGVHAGSPRKDIERALATINDTFRINDVAAVTRTMRGIGYVVVDSLQALTDQVRKGETP